jgi:hypothetical protein
MRDEFREGDWVRHPSYPEPVRVIGTGTTIAVQLPNGVMQAFEPLELQKVPTPDIPVRKVQIRQDDLELGSAERFTFVTTFGLFCLIMVVLVVIATITL